MQKDEVCNDQDHPYVRSEIDCRKEDINRIEHGHPLLQILLSCLQDLDTARPHANEICEEISSLKKAPWYQECHRKPAGQNWELCGDDNADVTNPWLAPHSSFSKQASCKLSAMKGQMIG